MVQSSRIPRTHEGFLPPGEIGSVPNFLFFLGTFVTLFASRSEKGPKGEWNKLSIVLGHADSSSAKTRQKKCPTFDYVIRRHRERPWTHLVITQPSLLLHVFSVSFFLSFFLWSATPLVSIVLSEGNVMRRTTVIIERSASKVLPCFLGCVQL